MPKFNPEEHIGKFVETRDGESSFGGYRTKVFYEDEELDNIRDNLNELLVQARNKKEELSGIISELEEDAQAVRDQLNDWELQEPQDEDDEMISIEEIHAEWEDEYDRLSDEEYEISRKISAIEDIVEYLDQLIDTLE